MVHVGQCRLLDAHQAGGGQGGGQLYGGPRMVPGALTGGGELVGITGLALAALRLGAVMTDIAVSSGSSQTIKA